MTPDERNMLNDLAERVSQMPATARDPEAEEIVRTKIGKRPDALYLMTQTVLIQNLALQRAQQQIEDLQRRGSQAQVGSGSSWLGQPSGSYSGGQQAQAPPPQQQYAPTPQYAPAPPPSSSFGGGGFLRGAAQTAAGVAAGTLAADAIGSMFSHHGGGLFGGNEFVGGSGAGPTEVINNYYDSPGGADPGLYPSGTHDANFVDPADMKNSDDTGAYADDSNSFADDSQFDDSGVDAGDGGFDAGDDDSYS
jgi:hypothetical protein